MAGLMSRSQISWIYAPVSGGRYGSEDGTLTMMAAAKKEVLKAQNSVLNTVGGRIIHVGEKPGMGQCVKASLQVLCGATYAVVFEAMVLGSKAGIPGRVLYEVFTSSFVGSPLLKTVPA